MRRYDAVVVGLGVMGAAAAASLARRGRRVLGVERFTPLHDRGSSHGASRIVRMAYFEHPDYVPLLRRAYDGWAELEATTGRSLITWTGALMIGPPTSAVVAGALASATHWELPHRLLDRGAMATAFPQFRLADHDVALHERHAGVVDADAAVRALHDVAALHGAELRFETAVAGWVDDGHVVEVAVGDGKVHADHVVVTTGPWLGRLLPGAVAVRPSRTVTYHYDGRDDFSPDRLPAFVWELAPDDSLYGLSEPSLGTCKFGFHDRLRDTDPDAVDRTVGAAEVAAMDAVLAERFPSLARPCRSSAVCLYTMTADHHFVVGPLPGTHGRVSVAGGCSGHGFKFAPAVGEILADLADGGATTAPIGLFDLARRGVALDRDP